jgi:ribosomal protein L11 methyltransferase
MRTWPVAIVEPPPAATLAEWEAFCALVLEAGCLGYEEGDGEDALPPVARFVFPAEAEGDWASAVRAAAGRIWPAQGPSISMEELREEDWGRKWWESHAPSQASSIVYVGPMEGFDSAPEGAVYVGLLPSSTFGTGEHPTTRLCLELLEEMDPAPECILDLGTGSGVLAIASIKLGARWAVGMDNDPACREAFERNVEANGCTGHCFFVAGSSIDEAIGGTLLAGVPMPDVVLCNMLSTEFDSLLVPIRQLGRPLILSGFLEGERECIEARLQETGWRAEQWRMMDEWCAVLARPA